MVELRDVITRGRMTFLRHRRLITAALTALTMVAILNVLAPAPAATAPLAVASHDLSSGDTLQSGDVEIVPIDPDLLPSGAGMDVSSLIGDVLAGPMRAGEPFTDRRLLGPALVAGYSGDVVATPVRISDADTVALLQVGDQIDVYSANGDQSIAAQRLVTAAPVVALPSVEGGGREGALIVLAVTDGDAARLAQAAATTQLSVSLRR